VFEAPDGISFKLAFGSVAGLDRRLRRTLTPVRMVVDGQTSAPRSSRSPWMEFLPPPCRVLDSSPSFFVHSDSAGE